MRVKAPRAVNQAPAVQLIVDEPKWRKDAPALRLIRRAARLALAWPGHADPGKGHGVAAATILLADDDRLRELSRDFRGRNKPTNVLSFPAQGPGAHVGDIAIAYGVTRSEARAQGKSFAAHAAHLAVHGVLHLLGYDHQQKKAAAAMELIEISVLSKVGIGDPYAPRPYTRTGKAA
jgi:probable rRNA maturation factor